MRLMQDLCLAIALLGGCLQGASWLEGLREGQEYGIKVTLGRDGGGLVTFYLFRDERARWHAGSHSGDWRPPAIPYTHAYTDASRYVHAGCFAGVPATPGQER
jgi:hypothetical protein